MKREALMTFYVRAKAQRRGWVVVAVTLALAAALHVGARAFPDTMGGAAALALPVALLSLGVIAFLLLAVAEQLLWACGVLDNELVSALSRGLAPANDVKAALRAMEDQGAIRRGYFVDGAAGLQYGTPTAVEALRALRSTTTVDEDVFVVSAIDPAQPFGADVPWPAPTSPRGPDCAPPQRAASSVAIVAAGRLVGLVVAGGKKILTFLADTEPERSQQARAMARGLAWIAASRLRDGRGTRLIVADVDGLDATGSAFAAHPLAGALGPAGFVKSAGGWVWPLPRQPVGPAASSTTTSPSPAPAGDDDLSALGADDDGIDDDGGFDVV